MGRSWIGLGLVTFFVAGCSGESSSTGDDDSNRGGTSGSGGTSGTGTGGTGGSAGSARPPKVGLRMMIRNPDPSVTETAGRTCPASSGVEWDLGAPVEMDGRIVDVDSPTPTDFGATLEDGEHDADVMCTVMLDGTFHVEGGGIDPQITPPDGTINFQMNGVAKKNGTPVTNTASVSVYTPRTLQIASNPGFPGCSVTAVHEQAPGALWADFDCPALTDSSDPNRACHASGTLVIEYCATGEDEN